MPAHKRTVGDRGPVTIPKEFRDRFGIESGDAVAFVDVENEIRILPPTDEERLAAGYRERASRSKELAAEMEGSSAEATRHLGDGPDWES